MILLEASQQRWVLLRLLARGHAIRPAVAARARAHRVQIRLEPNERAVVQIPETVNLHIWPKCNLTCSYCYGTFPERPRVAPTPEWLALIDLIARAGVRRVTFSGGEPTLHPDLDALIEHARCCGLQTSIITNGARLSDYALERLDLVGMTIDSANDELQRRLGRSLPRGASYREHVLSIARRAHHAGARLKLNTVVTALNVGEDMNDFLRAARPAKWKPLQFVFVPGENDATAAELHVERDAFDGFVARHRDLEQDGIWVVPEAESTIQTTYVMIDPSGRMFQHGASGHVLSRPVLEVGLLPALRAVGGYDREAFERRGGDKDVRHLPVVVGVPR